MELSRWLLWLGTRVPRFLGKLLPVYVFCDAILIVISGGEYSERYTAAIAHIYRAFILSSSFFHKFYSSSGAGLQKFGHVSEVPWCRLVSTKC